MNICLRVDGFLQTLLRTSASIIPRKGELVTIDHVDYVVIEVTHDYDKRLVIVEVKIDK